MKQIFKQGDRVFDIRYGWGKVKEIVDDYEYPVQVTFDNESGAEYTWDGKEYVDDLHPTLSFTEYFLQGFLQERPINYEDYIGCWGRFWDVDGGCKIESILEIIDTSDYPYCNRTGTSYRYFEPYPQEVLTALGLKNEK